MAKLEILPRQCCYRRRCRIGVAVAGCQHRPIHRSAEHAYRNIYYQMDTFLHPAHTQKAELFQCEIGIDFAR